VAKVKPPERLQPSLLDRLIDDKAGTDGHDAIDRRVMSPTELRRAVLRDLVWLFNATRFESDVDLSQAPQVQRSVLNFGLPALSGRPESAVGLAQLELAIRRAILDFEPRILADGLKVTAIPHKDGTRKAVAQTRNEDHHNVIGVEIRGQLWAEPVPLELLVRTEFDLETRSVAIADLRTLRDT
jgi:type VI secretion system protein ImpF